MREVRKLIRRRESLTAAVRNDEIILKYILGTE